LYRGRGGAVIAVIAVIAAAAPVELDRPEIRHGDSAERVAGEGKMGDATQCVHNVFICVPCLACVCESARGDLQEITLPVTDGTGVEHLAEVNVAGQ
jgi:hypothetical protein